MRKTVLIASIVILILPVFILFSTGITPAADTGLEKDLQGSLEESRSVIERARKGLREDRPVANEVTRLKTLTESIRASHMLMKERFRLREDKIGGMGAKAIERHRVISEGYLKVLEEYLALVENLPLEEGALELILGDLETLLDKILPKKEPLIFGSLPYRSLNYSSKEPDEAPSITPAYQGGDKTVSPDDLRSAPEAPISLEITAHAGSLDWNPASIYEWVKNNVETEWYWGCMKGAEETLRQGSGNDCDQASLLVALLRASGFPSRYVMGVIEFYPGIDVVKNLTGIEDPQQIAVFFQKAGIPYTPVIAGGGISNFQIEHIWVESRIPYANYRGAIIDEHGKAWLGLDTSIKVSGYTENTPADILDEFLFSNIRDEYLGALQTQTPLEYIRTGIEDYLAQIHPDMVYEDLLKTRTLNPEILDLLPASLQFRQINITHEYTEIPDELIHKVRFIVTDSNNSELLNSELRTLNLSNQEIALSYEPETVEDQEIIDSYGGLGNTPAYLVRLRPALKLNGEDVAVGRDGLPIGAEFDLTIELISPVGIETITNTHITGNYAVIGIVSQRAVQNSEFGVESVGAKSAYRLLYEEAMNYISRWNQAEEELASLMHVTIARPVPTMVTLGGVMDVTYLLDTPHGFEWKGVYVDADLRVIELVQSSEFGVQSERLMDFMRLSSLQGSILENRILEDDFQVVSISTAKLFEIANSNQIPILTIDRANIDGLLFTLPFVEAIKEEIRNAVNQGLVVTIPETEVTYEDWTGVGWIEEDPETGESGWMLSGMIAGAMTVGDRSKWEQYAEDVKSLLLPYKLCSIISVACLPNLDPNAAVYIYKIKDTDRQVGTVNNKLGKSLKILVLDKSLRPVQDAEVHFNVNTGGGILKGYQQEGAEIFARTDNSGYASVDLTLGKYTKDNPNYIKVVGEKYPVRAGENIVYAQLLTGSGASVPFVAYGRPDEPHHLRKLNGEERWGDTLTWNGFVSVSLEDMHDNPIANRGVNFSISGGKDWEGCQNSYLNQNPMDAYLIDPSDHCLLELELGTLDYSASNCNQKTSLSQLTSSDGIALVYIMLGEEPGVQYTITASYWSGIGPGISETFVHYTWGHWELLMAPYGSYEYGSIKCEEKHYPFTDLILETHVSVDASGNTITARKPGESIDLDARLRVLKETEITKQETTDKCGGQKPCSMILGQMSFYFDNNFDFKKPNVDVTFNGTDAVLDPLDKGFYTYKHTVKKGVEEIDIQAKAAIKGVRTSLDCSQQDVCGLKNEVFKKTAGAKLKVYGVEIESFELQQYSLETDSFYVNSVVVDADGFTKEHSKINYDITPSEYQARNAYVVLLKKEGNDYVPIEYLPSEKKGHGRVVIAQGHYFDHNGDYAIEVVLNAGDSYKNPGLSNEIKSNRIPLTVYKGDSDIEIYKPRVVDVNESMIPDAEELIKGSVTFVNLDNDDQDGRYDYDGVVTHDDVVTGGDDELVKIKLKLKPNDLSKGLISLHAKTFAGGDHIKVWKQNDKAKTSEYTLGDGLNVPTDFKVEGDYLVKELWVEGIKAHNNSKKSTVLSMSYEVAGTVVSEDEAALTIVGVEKIEWIGKGNSVNNDNTLDNDPNWPFSLVRGVRVFPGSRLISKVPHQVETTTLNKVPLKVTLTVPSPYPIEIYLKPFDVDDPTSDLAPIDDDALGGEDNRGKTAGGLFLPTKAGGFPYLLPHKYEDIFMLEFDKAEKERTAEFQVTTQPGDNFRICVNGDVDFLDRLENDDQKQDVGNSDLERSFNKQRIVHKDITGTPIDREAPGSANYCSHTLTVWRFLHVEVDSMGQVTGNEKKGNITAFEGWDPSVNLASKAIEVKVDNNLDDGSKDLDDTPSKMGRFEKGTLTVAGATVIGEVDGNGNNRISKLAGMNIVATPLPFTAMDNSLIGGSTMSGYVTEIRRSGGGWTFELNNIVGPAVIDWSGFVGGSISIGGGPSMSITATFLGTSTVEVAGMKIPFTLKDDDKITGNVAMPDTSMLIPAFKPAYVLPVFDVGDNNTNVPFVLNVDPPQTKAVYDFDAGVTEADNNFWTVYLLGAYQASTVYDADPDSEFDGIVIAGVVDAINGEGAKTFKEISNEGIKTSLHNEAITTAHEVGHLFNGLHPDKGLMASSKDRKTIDFSGETLNKIRSIDHP